MILEFLRREILLLSHNDREAVLSDFGGGRDSNRDEEETSTSSTESYCPEQSPVA